MKEGNNMNKYLQEMKQAVIEYNETAKKLSTRLANARQIYLPEAFEAEQKIIEAERAKAREKATEAICKARDNALQSIKGWGTAHGEQLTDDIKLLDIGITPKQFSELVDRHKDNYTMLLALSNYGNRRNAELAKESHGIPTEHYPVEGILKTNNTPEHWNKLTNEAINTLSAFDDVKYYGESYNAMVIEHWGENVDI